jgi:phytoene dehydrogenase-like protein
VAGVGNRARKMSLDGLGDLIELFGRSASDMLDQWFETDVLKGVLGYDAVIRNYASPYHLGSAYVLLHHVFGEVNGIKGAWGHAVGGMGAITQAMMRACVEAGVTFSVDSPVCEITVSRTRRTVPTAPAAISARAISAKRSCHTSTTAVTAVLSITT